MNTGRQRNAAVTGANRKAKRSCEKPPPEVKLRMPAKATSTAASDGARRGDGERRSSSASAPRAYSENAAMATRKPVSVGSGFGTKRSPMIRTGTAARRRIAMSASASSRQWTCLTVTRQR